MKAAGFEKAVSFNLQEVIVLYEPASVEELALSISHPQMYLFNIFHWLLSILPYLTRQRIIYASGHAACRPYPLSY